MRDALDQVLIGELAEAFTELQQDDAVRVLVLAGRGAAFCAGGDLAWMKRMAGYGSDRKLQDAKRLARMLKTVHASAKPVIARVHGPAFAGGKGLAAACDIVVAEPAAEFRLSEVRIGLIPATISPYVMPGAWRAGVQTLHADGRAHRRGGSLGHRLSMNRRSMARSTRRWHASPALCWPADHRLWRGLRR